MGLKGTAFSHPPGPPTRFSLLFSSLAALRLTARVRLRHVWGASHPPMRGLVLRLRVRGYPEKLAGPSVPGTAYLLRPLAVRPGMRVHMCFVSCCVCLAPHQFLRNAVCRARGAPRDLLLATRSSMKGCRPTRPLRWLAPACPKRDPFYIPLVRCPRRTPNAPPTRVTAPRCLSGQAPRCSLQRRAAARSQRQRTRPCVQTCSSRQRSRSAPLPQNSKSAARRPKNLIGLPLGCQQPTRKCPLALVPGPQQKQPRDEPLLALLPWPAPPEPQGGALTHTLARSRPGARDQRAPSLYRTLALCVSSRQPHRL